MFYSIRRKVAECTLVTLVSAATICGSFYLIQHHDLTATQIVINEVATDNFSMIMNDHGKYTDYVEFYNPTDQDVQMTNMYLSNSRINYNRFELDHVVVPANGYAVVWLTGTKETDGIHAPFRLSKNGDELYLTRGSGLLVDQVKIPSLATNTCYSRMPDGKGEFKITTCSAGQSNDIAELVADQNLSAPVFSAESGFYENAFLLEIAARGGRVHILHNGWECSDNRINTVC